jgi:hypothetical protein
MRTLAYVLVFVAGISCLSGCAFAEGGESSLTKSLFERVDKMDSDHLTTTGVSAAVDGGCDVNRLLASIANRNNEAFGTALESAEERYISASELLFKASTNKAFQKPIDVTKWNIVVDIRSELRDVKTQSDLLQRIALKAKESAAALDRIKNGVGSEKDLNLVIKNSADIPRMIAALYDILVA